MHHIMVFPLGSELIKSGGKSQTYWSEWCFKFWFVSPISSLWVCYMSWVSSDFWQPYSDVHGALSSEPYSVPANSCQWLLWSQSILYLSSSFPTAFCFSQHYCLFQRTLPFHVVPEVGLLQFCLSASSDISGLICSQTHLFVFLAVHSICTTLFQYQIWNEFIFSYHPSSLSNFCIPT